MSSNETDRAHWFKSSYSNAQSACVEAGAGVPGVVPVRDSKDADSPVLCHTASAWAEFVSAVKADHFRA